MVKVAVLLMLALPLVMAGMPSQMDLRDIYTQIMGKGDKGPDDKDKQNGGKDGDMMKEFMENMGKMMGMKYEDKKDDDKDKDKDKGMEEVMEKFRYMMKQMNGGDKMDNQEKIMKEFAEHMKNKQEEKDELEKAKMELYEKMKLIKAKKMATEKMHEMSMRFQKQSLMFTYEVTSHLLEMCDCDSSKDIIMRLKEGKFGEVDSMSSVIGDFMAGQGDGKNDQKDVTVYEKPSQEDFYKLVMKFAKMSHEEQVKHVTYDLVKVMCGAAKQFFSHLKQVEFYLIQYKKAMIGKKGP